MFYAVISFGKIRYIFITSKSPSLLRLHVKFLANRRWERTLKYNYGIQCQINSIWAATWQNQQNDCAPSEDSDQPGHPHCLVFAVRMKKAQVVSYPLSAQRRLWSDWADAQSDLSLRWAHTHFLGFIMSRVICVIYSPAQPCLSTPFDSFLLHLPIWLANHSSFKNFVLLKFIM